jgi:hypothetical protein
MSRSVRRPRLGTRHVGVSFYSRAYAPGAITAVVLVLPITLYLIFCTRIRDSKKAPAQGF